MDFSINNLNAHTIQTVIKSFWKSRESVTGRRWHKLLICRNSSWFFSTLSTGKKNMCWCETHCDDTRQGKLFEASQCNQLSAVALRNFWTIEIRELSIRSAFWIERNCTTTVLKEWKRVYRQHAGMCSASQRTVKLTWWLAFFGCFNFRNGIDRNSLRSFYSKFVWRLGEGVIVDCHRKLFHIVWHKRVDPHHKQLGIFRNFTHLQIGFITRQNWSRWPSKRRK